jgi:MFS family permease
MGEFMKHTKEMTPRLPIPVPFYYGWIIVGMAAMGLFFSGPGQTYSISIFIDSYTEHFGWSRSLISSIYLAATLLAGSLMFIIGRLIDKYGQRNMSVYIAMLLGVACVLNSFVVGPIMLFFGFFMLRLFGQGSMSLIPGTLVPQWFIKQRGRALSIMAIGGFLSSASLPLFNAWLISTWGWPVAWRVWAGLLFLFFVPLAFLLIRNKPEDIGLLPDNAIRKQKYSSEEEEKIYKEIPGNIKQGQADPQEDVIVPEVNWTLKEAMRERAFWLILFCVAIPSMVNTGIVFHFVSILGENGITRNSSALILSIMALVAFPITFIAGFVVERVKVNLVLAASFLGQGLVMVLLIYTDSMMMAILFGIARGIVGGFEVISLGIIWPNYFGREHLGSIKGLAMTMMVVGSAFGPLPFALAYDWFGGYTQIILLMALFPLLGMIASFISPAPKKEI